MEFELSEKGEGNYFNIGLTDGPKEDEYSKLLTGERKVPTGNSTSGFPFKIPSNSNPRRSRAPPVRKGKQQNGKESFAILNVLAAQTLKIASINGLGELDKLEHDLEEEISYENRSQAKTQVGRLRREGHHHLHGKAVLFLVVILNIIDCLLVMGELTLDFHHVSHLLQNKKAMIDSFSDILEEKYSPNLDDVVGEERHILLQSILDADILWRQNIVQTAANNVTMAAAQCYSYVTSAANHQGQSFTNFVASLPISNWSTAQPLSSCFHPLVDIFRTANGQTPETAENEYILSSLDHPNEKLIVVAHKLHYISVAILSVLVLLLIVKIICAGKRFLKSKMQVFDGIVILISFIIDLVFIKGVHIFQTNDFVIILTFLLPWRIIRVLNSLIAAVLDKQRLNLKIIYTQKKKISRNLSEVNNKVEVMQRQIQILQGLCSSRGITDGDVRRILGTDKPDGKHKHDHRHESKKNNHHGGGGLASMMALGKLAFQAADALAPMPDNSGRSTPSSPISTPMFEKYPVTSINSTASTPPSTPAVSATNGVAHPPANGSVPKSSNSSKNNNNNNVDGTFPNTTHNNATSINNTTTDESFQENVASQNKTGGNAVSENREFPEVSQSPSLDYESAATISVDLKDDDDLSSVDEVKIDLAVDNATDSPENSDGNHLNELGVTSSRL